MSRFSPEVRGKHQLQLRIGLGVLAMCILVAASNFIQLSTAFGESFGAALTDSSVSVVLAGGFLFAAGALRDSNLFRTLQVVVFWLLGWFGATTATPGNLTSAIFIVIGFWLHREYGYRIENMRWTAPAVILVYLACLTIGYGSEATDRPSVLATANAIFFALGLVYIFWHLWNSRVWSYRTREQELEDRVSKRTDELERTATELREALSERNLLIREIHHRVKNNLQLTSSLLRLAKDQSGLEESREILETSNNRIRSIALVHERLYQSEAFAQVDLGLYVRDLLDQLQRSFNARLDSDIGLPSPYYVDLDFAVPFGLILNELVTNAFQHGFPPEAATGARVSVRIEEDQAGLILHVRDNGAGLPKAFDVDSSMSMGIQIIRSLVEQLKGTMSAETNRGAHWRIYLPRPPAREGSSGGGGADQEDTRADRSGGDGSDQGDTPRASSGAGS